MAWVTGVLLLVCTVIFAVIYVQSTRQLRSQIDADVGGDVSQLSQAVRSLKTDSPTQLASAIDRYVRAQPLTGTSSLLFAVVPGHGTVSNHPELFGGTRPEPGETAGEQQRENAEGAALLQGPLGLSTRRAPDLGEVRIDERLVSVGGLPVRVGAGEPLIVVTRAERSIAKSFLIAGRDRGGAGADRLVSRGRLGVAAAAADGASRGASRRRRPAPADAAAVEREPGDPGAGREL